MEEARLQSETEKKPKQEYEQNDGDQILNRGKLATHRTTQEVSFERRYHFRYCSLYAAKTT